MQNYVSITIVLASLSASIPASGADFASPKGFSLSYPDGWQMATAEQLTQAVAVVNQAAVNGPELVAALAGPGNGEFAPNVNIVVRQGQIVLDEKMEKTLLAGFQNGPGQVADDPTVRTCHLTINGVRAFAVEYNRPDQSLGKLLRQATIVLPGKRQAYIVTCTSLKSQWDASEEVFDRIVKSIKIDLDDKVSGIQGEPQRRE